MVGGHSDGVEIEFDRTQPEGSLRMKHLGHPSTPGAARIFEPEPLIIFNSCSADGNIAQVTSEKLHCWTIGFSEPGQIDGYNIIQINSRPFIVPTIRNENGEDITTIYFNGNNIPVAQLLPSFEL